MGKRFYSFLIKRAEIHTIRTKLIISFLLIALLPLIIMTILSQQIYFGTLLQRGSDYSQEVVNRIARDLDEYFFDIEKMLTREQDFYIDQFIKLAQGSDFNNRKYVFRIWEDLNNLQRVKPGLEEISLLFSHGYRVSSYGLYSLDFSAFQNDLGTELKSDGIRIMNPHANFLNQQVVTMVKPYSSPGEDYGVFLAADINLSHLANLTDVKLGTKDYIFLANSQGQLIYHPNHELINTSSVFYQSQEPSGFVSGLNQQGQENYVLTTAYSSETGWNVVSVAFADELEAELAPIKKLTFLVVGIVLLAVILLSFYLSHALSQPIKELHSLTQRAANNELDVQINLKGNDEIAQLGQSFNKMVERIQDLLNENVKEQKMLRKLEMESLANQIKPHFIYNTLDLIIGQLESNKTSEASYLIEALGNFFRLSLSQGQELVPIANEVDHVRNYLFIQQLRHGEEYQYEIKIKEAEILTMYIPRLLLQPLVENAIYHGILSAKRPGKITLVGYRQAEYIIFEIRDDGSGIKPEKLNDINEVLQGVRQLKHEREYFGLRNVNQRAKLMFGNECGVLLTSELGQGTIAHLKIKPIEVEYDV